MSDFTTVNAPDGSQIRFPASMSQDEILAVMREKFPPQVPADQAMMEGFGGAFTKAVSGVPMIGEAAGRFLENRSPETQSRVAAAALMGANGATFGMLDEIAGQVSRLGGNDAGQVASGVNRLKETAREQYPVTSTLAEIAGSTVTGGAAAKAAGFNPVATTGRTALTSGTSSAVLSGAEAEGGLKERGTEAAKGFGAGFALGYAGDKLLRVAGGKIKSLIEGRNFIQNGQLTVAARDVMRQAGVNPDDLGRDDLVSIVQTIQKGFSPDEAARLTDAQSLPVPVNLSKGQVLRRNDDLRLENAARDGLLGPRSERVAKEAFRDQDLAIQQNAQAFRDQMTGLPRVDKGEGGIGAGEVIQRNAGDLKDRAIAAREAATAGQATTPVDLLSGIIGQVRSKMDEAGQITGTDARSAVEANFLRQAEAITERAKSGRLPVNALARLRADVSKASADATGSARSYLGEITEQIDAALDDVVERGLIEGDPEAVKAWGESTALFRDYFQRYQGKKGAEALVKRIVNGDVEPERISQLLFAGTQAKGTSQGLALARNLRTELGADSEAWNAIRGEALTRLFQEGDGGLIGVRFSTQLEKALTQDGAMMRTLFNADEILALRRFARVVRAINATASNRGNPSASGNTLAFLSRALGGPAIDTLRGLPGISGIVDAVSDGSQARKVQKLVSGPN